MEDINNTRGKSTNRKKNKNKSQQKKNTKKDQNEQIKELYYELNPEEKQVKKKLDFNQTLDKFQNFIQQKQLKLEEQKLLKQQEEEIEFPEVDFDQEQFLQREEEFLKKKQQKQQQLKEQLEKEKQEKEYKPTFKPEINPNNMKRSINDLINWKLEKEKKNKEAYEKNLRIQTQKVQKNNKTNEKVYKNNFNTKNTEVSQMPVSERLYQYQSVYNKNKKQKEIEIYGEEKKKKVVDPSVSSIHQPSRAQTSFYTAVTTQTQKKSFIKDLEGVEKELFQPEEQKIETHTWKEAEKERKRREKEQKKVQFDKNTRNNEANDQKKSLIKMFESRTNLLYDNKNFKPYEGPNNFEQDNAKNAIMNLQSFGDFDQSIIQPDKLKMPDSDINDIKASFKQLERLKQNQQNPFHTDRDMKVKQYFDQYTPGEKYVFQNMPDQEEQENNSFFSQEDISEVPQEEIDKEFENHLDPEIGQIPSFKKTFLMQEYLDPDRQEEEKSNLRQPKKTMTEIYDEQLARMMEIKRKKEEKLEQKKKLLEKTFRQRRQTNQYGKIHNEKILKVTQFNIICYLQLQYFHHSQTILKHLNLPIYQDLNFHLKIYPFHFLILYLTFTHFPQFFTFFILIFNSQHLNDLFCYFHKNLVIIISYFIISKK